MNDFIQNPQTRNARAFLPLNISAVGSVDIVHISIMQLQKGVVPIVHCFTKMPPPKCKKSQNEKEENKYQGQKLKKFDVN